MTNPVRIQLSRRKGFNLQAVSVAINGLSAVNVARPTKWGNPFAIGQSRKDDNGFWDKIGTAETAVKFFRDMLSLDRRNYPDASQIVTLRGKNLACWCKLGDPCHADVLLDICREID
jgi:hypothetical protein